MLPLLVSVPHAGTWVPPEVRDACILTPEDIAADGDGGAGEIYAIQDHVQTFVTTHVARAIVDMNRAPDDVRKDGVVKTHTCWDVPIYREPLTAQTAAALIARYHAPYHEALSRARGVLAGVDCHTMAATAPPEAPDPGQERPPICLGDADGTLPRSWSDALAEELERAFSCEVRRNEPFSGGYIIRHHRKEMPWVQLELSRSEWMPLDEKRRCVLEALSAWCRRIGP